MDTDETCMKSFSHLFLLREARPQRAALQLTSDEFVAGAALCGRPSVGLSLPVAINDPAAVGSKVHAAEDARVTRNRRVAGASPLVHDT
jgi:hypothetical protein